MLWLAARRPLAVIKIVTVRESHLSDDDCSMLDWNVAETASRITMITNHYRQEEVSPQQGYLAQIGDVVYAKRRSYYSLN